MGLWRSRRDWSAQFCRLVDCAKRENCGHRFRSMEFSLHHKVLIKHTLQGLTARVLHNSRLAPTQARIIPVAIAQSFPFTKTEIRLEVYVASPTSELTIPVVLHLKQLPAWNYSDYHPIASTYFYASSIPTAFIAVPPQETGLSGTKVPLLFLRMFLIDSKGRY